MSGLLDRLESLGVVQTVDAALGRLLASKSTSDLDPAGRDHLAIAAALASAALAQGHSCLLLNALHEFVAGDEQRSLDAIDRDLPTPDALRAALIASPLVARDADAPAALVLDENDRLYLRRYFCYEQTVAQSLRERLDRTQSDQQHDVLSDAKILQSSLARYFGDTAAADDEQRIAVLLALRSRFLIVTGGPGSGKTSTVLRLLAITIEQALDAGQPAPRIALTAPTGKAAARLSETLRAPIVAASGTVQTLLPRSATTLHRLLGIHPGRVQPRYDRGHPLPYDMVIVDEASMLDLALAARLCAALPAQAHLVLLGDRDQLASVEAGSVFGALCAAAGEPNRYSASTAEWLENILLHKVEHFASLKSDSALRPAGRLADALVELRGSHRFGADSAIARFARAVRAGASDAALDILAKGGPELRMVAVAESSLVQTLVAQVLPYFTALATLATPEAALEQMDSFRVLCALREGVFGATAINATIEHELRRHNSTTDAQGWFAGRLVMIGSNDYAQGLFNGDIGVALPSGENGVLEVWFRSADGSTRALPPALLPAHQGAFALTVHKAQGSEFDDVLIVLPPSDARVLTRELLYTAVTRARKKVELWTSGEILVTTIARSTHRWSGIADVLNKI